jgi:NAD+ synthase (glutamine-hydrolysing)
MQVAVGNDLLFESRSCADFVLHVEICEDLWVPVPPSSYAALAGATVLANLSASNATIGKADYRRLLCTSQSAKCIAAYVYASAGYGESTTDLAWDGHAIACENGEALSEPRRFEYTDSFITRHRWVHKGSAPLSAAAAPVPAAAPARMRPSETWKSERHGAEHNR